MLLDDFTIYCTEEQTKKAFELGAPIKLCGWNELTDGNLKELLIKNKQTKLFSLKNGTIMCGFCPTAEQMIAYLESKGFYFRLNTNGCSVEIDYDCILEIVNTNRKKATLQAIDKALDYYINTLK